VVVRPLNGIVSYRRLPGIRDLTAGFRRRALFRGSASHQLRVATAPLAISVFHSKASSCLHRPQTSGEKMKTDMTVPTGLADSRDQPLILCARQAANVHGRTRMGVSGMSFRGNLCLFARPMANILSVMVYPQ
jgi:hypothetical protein